MQHDYNIADQTGLSFLSDLNNLAAAIVTNNSGTTEPTTTFAGMWWLDTNTDPPLLKRRNQADTGWEYIAISEIEGLQTALDTITSKTYVDGSVTITPGSDADVTLNATQEGYGRLVLVDGAWTTGRNIIVSNTDRRFWVDNSAGTYTATVKTSAGTGIAVAAGTSRPLVCDGTNVVDPLTNFDTPGIFTIGASVAANALTVTLNPCTIDFRSATLGSGTVNRRRVNSAISVTVSSGSTLGTVNAVASRLAVIAIDNAGTVELAVVNLAGGNNLDETTLISTTAEGGAGAADSANVIYSTTARTNVPFRVVGIVESTQATAGTWATAPSLIQGAGGNSVTSMQSIGYGQTWQDVTASRALATTYYNTTGKPILVTMEGYNTAASFSVFTATVGGNKAGYARALVNASGASLAFIVPIGMQYSISASGGTPSLVSWTELR